MRIQKIVLFLVITSYFLGGCFTPGTAPIDWLSTSTITPPPFTITPTPLPTQTDTPTSTATLSETITPLPTDTPTPEPLVRFAVIGDYGSGNQNAKEVADLVKSWIPDFIITTGDNNYPDGSASTIDHRIGQFYHEYIHPYKGVYGAGAEENRFFPCLGNHDWMTPGAEPYLDYFTLPGNERYYDFTWGTVHLFALNSDPNEPDGVGLSSRQAAWLREKLASSNAIWKIVYMHVPPYSSGYHGSIDWAVWPYKEWGATAVLSGHDHDYERLIINGFPYFVNGLGGGAIYNFGTIIEGSKVRFNADYGAMLVVAGESELTFQFITRNGFLVDTFTINR